MTTHIRTPWGADLGVTFNDSYATTYSVTRALGAPRLTFRGTCPFCGGGVDYAVELELVPNDPSALIGQGATDLQVMIECTCSEQHPGRPPSGRGCGQTWTIVVEARP